MAATAPAIITMITMAMIMTTTSRTTTTMSTPEPLSPAALRRLLLWLSPSYPVGGFSYSHGLERAIEDGDIVDRATLLEWIEEILRHGSGRSDLILLAQAWRAACAGDLSTLSYLADLAIALSISAERRLETVAQGEAFLRATRSAWGHPLLDQIAAIRDAEVAYPLAVGAAAAAHDIPLASTASAFLASFAASLVSAGVRLIPLGQTDALKVLAELDSTIELLADKARRLTLDNLGGATFRTDIAAMRHETQETRLFRS